MLTIQTNVSSLNSQRNLSSSSNSLSVSLQRLSSGLRINSAKDDAAGLAISERFTAQIRGTDQATRNANDGISLAQTGESALGQMGTILQRVRELAVQASNATNSASDRQAINQEVGQLVAELDRFSTQTEFNGSKLLDGSFASATFQIGANAMQTVTATTANFRTSNYGTNQVGVTSGAISTAVTGASVTSTSNASAVVTTGGDLSILGSAASASVTLADTDSAKDVATKINAQSKTGVKATAYTESTYTFGATGSYTLAVYGSNTTKATVSFNVTATSTAAGLADAVTAFNNQSSKTGITAKLSEDNTGVVLTAADGSNIHLVAEGASDIAGSITAGTTSASLATGAAGSITVGGQLIFDSDKSFTLKSGTAVIAANALDGTGLAAAASVASGLKAVQDLDVSSYYNSTQAIRIVDQALASVNSQRASFGALQSRFEATVSQLQASSENLSAARSRIRDADFASETANLTRNQILQQAGTAMLAQANSLPQTVLSLLK